MAKEKFERTKPHVNVGTIGHSNHGKTTLTAAILQVQKKQLSAGAISYSDIDENGDVFNKTKTVTIKSADVEYESLYRHYTHIDCPGLPDYTKNMFYGAAQMDCAILVVSALDSVQPQTLEHIILARQAGVNHVVVFLNKCDAVDDPEKLELIELEVRELLNRYRFDGDAVPVIHGSALAALQGELIWEESITRLIEAIDRYVPKPERDTDEPFLMSVTDVFYVESLGTVAKGVVKRGKIVLGDIVELIGIKGTKRMRVSGMEMFGKALEYGIAGDLMTCLFKGTEFEEINRDQVLAKPGSITPHTKFQAEVHVLKKEEGGRHTPFFTNYRPQFLIGNADVTGIVTLPEGTEMVMPGDKITITIELIAPIYMEEQMGFAIRDGNQTIGTGVVTKIRQ